MRALLIIAALALSGCNAVPVTPVAPVKPGVLAQVDTQAEELRKADAEAKRIQAERDSKLASSLEVMGRQIATLPPTPAQIILSAEQTFSMRLLGSIVVSPEDRAAAAERESLFMAGRAVEARKMYDDANAKADDLNAKVAAANALRAAAEAKLAADIEAAGKKLADQQAQHERDMAAQQARHQRELAEAHSEVLRDQVAKLNYAGAACEGIAIALIGVGFFFGGLAALRKIVPIAAFLGFAGLLAFGLAQIVGQWWFKWACLGAVALIGVWVMVWLIRHYRDGDLKQEAEARAAKLTAVVKDVIPALDHVYDAGTETLDELKARGLMTVRDILDSELFSKLTATMDRATKATVHEIRAESIEPAK